jgi:hypothetical protein
MLTSVALLLTACGQSDPQGAGTFNPAGTTAPDTAAPAATAVVTPTMSVAEVNKMVLKQYRTFQAAYATAYESNDATGLADSTMDPLLSQITTDIAKTKAKHEFWRFHNVLNPKVQAHLKDGVTVVVLDCVRALIAARFSAKTGKRLGEKSGPPLYYQAVVKYDGTTWKVSSAKWGNKC